ncbi:regulator SirB [Candidatus Tenderia electrophaga]|jgi:uncharacterized membrane protein SirB2|uniref:Regulator SirB n=1 Tax=Candidatus Tenderia electrophaga TaxID=1748243 RepID=A0A0S2TFW1_9GAMM|nr:regulator SirB [Candidatus Tenderia electrophaga]
MDGVKLIHVGSAVVSILGFILRGILMMRESALLRTRWVRTLPHVVDATLLFSAIWLAVQYGFNPANSPWLAAKIVGLLVYIGLGLVALRLGKTRNIRITAWWLALLVFAYIVVVALTKSPLPLFCA